MDGYTVSFATISSSSTGANSLPSLGLSAAEQREFQQRMERKQMKEFMGVSQLYPFHSSTGLVSLYQRSKSVREAKLIFPPSQMFSSLVDRCFDHCIDDFTTKSLIAREQGCVSRCVQKFMAGSERIGQRFAEQQAQMMNGQGGGR